jgi:allantoinase
MDFDLVLTGKVIGHDSIIENGWVAVRDGRVGAVGEGTPPAARERQDFKSGMILPGAIDAQVHSLSQKQSGRFHLVDALGRSRRCHHHRRHAL